MVYLFTNARDRIWLFGRTVAGHAIRLRGEPEQQQHLGLQHRSQDRSPDAGARFALPNGKRTLFSRYHRTLGQSCADPLVIGQGWWLVRRLSWKFLGLILGCALVDFYRASFPRICAYLLDHHLGNGLLLGFLYLLSKDSGCWRPSGQADEHDGGLEPGEILLGKLFG